MTKVAVVILNYNTADLLTQLLPSVVNSSYPDLEIIVADNGSTDHSRQAVEAFPSVSWMDLGKNYGYAEGYNRALENLDANYAVLLNSDVEVTPNWVEPLVDFIENNPEYVALQPKIKSYPDLEIIVADNGSTDHSRQAVKAFPSVRWMELGENHGYAEGYNRALSKIDAKYVVLLNSDVEVTPNWIEPLVDFIENNPEYVALQPKIKSYHAKDYFEYAGASGGFMDYLGYPFCRGRIFDELEQDTGQYNDSIDIFWASGAALFISLEAFRTAGGLDKKLFAHMEEIDLAWRIQLMGKKIACIPASEVYHIGGGTLSHQSAKKTYLNFRNSLVLLARYNKGFTRITKVGLRLILDFPAALLFLSKGRINDVFAIMKAHWHFLLRLNYWAKPLSFPNKNTKPAGYLPKSIVYLHYLKKVKTFEELKSLF